MNQDLRNLMVFLLSIIPFLCRISRLYMLIVILEGYGCFGATYWRFKLLLLTLNFFSIRIWIMTSLICAVPFFFSMVYITINWKNNYCLVSLFGVPRLLLLLWFWVITSISLDIPQKILVTLNNTSNIITFFFIII